MPSTFSPDPQHLGTGAGTAAQQSARPREYADTDNGGYDVAATGATAGSPGTWTPSGARPPSTLAGCAGLTASPATAWTTGQHVLLADGTTHVHWNGTAWASGNGTAAAADEEGSTRKGGRGDR
jgi:hypothetical protein